MGRDCRNLRGAGAAGGLGYAFMQYLGAECRSGVELLLETIHFSEMLNGASLVVTGEGRADKQTLMGKLPFGILQAAQAQGVPTVLLAGQVADKEALLQAGFSRVECINPPGLPLDEAMKKEVAVRGLEGYTGPVPL
jgi:glycerate kinase